MHTLGIRVSVEQKNPKGKVYYSIVEKDFDNEFEIKKISFINMPIALDVPEKMAYLRTNLLAIIMQYNIQNAGLRITETIARNPIVFRMNLEGVIQELFANSSVESYELLNITRISGFLSEDKGNVKSYFEGKDTFLGLDESYWKSLKTEERECVVAAVAMSVQG